MLIWKLNIIIKDNHSYLRQRSKILLFYVIQLILDLKTITELFELFLEFEFFRFTILNLLRILKN